MSYASGDYYVICARCGCKKLRSETMIDVSQGQDSTKPVWFVCKKHMDGVHPQTKRIPFIQDPRPVPGPLSRPETIIFRDPPAQWQNIICNWEDVDYVWESLTNENSVANISKTLVGKD